MHSRKTRICFVAGSHWAATFGGAQYQIKCIIEELIKKQRYKIFYLARDVNPTYTPKDYEIIPIGKGRNANKFPLFLDAIELFRMLKQINPDIIYQRVFNAYTGIAAYYAKQYQKKMVWHIAHDDDVRISPPSWRNSRPSRLLDYAIGQYGIRNACAIIAQTEVQKHLLQTNHSRQPNAVIHNFQPEPQESLEKEKHINIVWVGNFKPMKRPELFVRLAADLKGMDEVKLHMIGRPGNNRLYGPLISQISKLQNLRYYGEQSLVEVNHILSKSHLFINTSIAEGFPNTFIQAWMRKVPVVSLGVDVDGILQTRQYGIYTTSYQEMLYEIIKLIRNRTKIEKMACNARKLALRHFSLANAQQIINILNAYTSRIS